MPKVKEGDTVKVHYTGKLNDGTRFDTSSGRDPLSFTVGQGQVIPGFEQGVVGMEVGESKTITIPTDQAYGPKRDELVAEVDKARLADDVKPEVGTRLQMKRTDGQMLEVVITDVEEDKITIDANHPLAGQDLTFDIEVVGVG